MASIAAQRSHRPRHATSATRWESGTGGSASFGNVGMGKAANVMNSLICQWTPSEKGEEPQLVLTSLDVKTTLALAGQRRKQNCEGQYHGFKCRRRKDNNEGHRRATRLVPCRYAQMYQQTQFG
jgi:hypothetical protein